MFQKLKDILQTSNNGNNLNVVNASNSKKTMPHWIKKLASNGKHCDSPINIDINLMKRIECPSLKWKNYEVEPKKLKITNTGHTLILSGKWYRERPYLSEGPLDGKYVFSQLHFHWGSNNEEGSEHTVDGKAYPLEMHVVHFKSVYLTQEHALKEKDGLCVLSYFFKIQKTSNFVIQEIIDAIPLVQKCHMSTPLITKPINSIVKPFTDDYFMYWGSITTNNCLHMLLWLLSREPIGISTSQLDYFRQLLDSNNDPLVRNYRRVIHSSNTPQVFHVNPIKITTLMPPNISKNSFLSLYNVGGYQERIF